MPGSRTRSTFVGLGHKFQIWEPDRFQSELAEATQKVRALKAAARLSGGGAQRARSTGMTAGGDGSAVAGGPAPHIPVLGRPALDFLNVRDGGVYIDGTFGAGGYTRAILAAADCKVIGIDRDPSAIALGADLVEAASGRLTLVEDRFSNLDAVAHDCGVAAVDGVVLDLGVSSMQLDTAERGFSFRLDGPLDMRMGGEGPSAADVVNAAAERDLANIIFLLGEERHSRAVARAIVKARDGRADRDHARARRHRRLAWCARAPGDIHPATRTFQALRIFVNDELGELVAGAARRRAHSQARRPAGRGVVPFARRPHRQDVPRRRAARRAAARATRPNCKRAAPTFTRADQAAGRRRRRPRSRAIRAPARPSCAPPSAPTRRARDGDVRRSAAAPAVARRRHEGALSMRLLNILVIGALILAASYVYKIKFESTLQAERVAKLAGEIRRERDAIATLRAEWAKLDTPGRIQGLAERHLDAAADRSRRSSTLSTVCPSARRRSCRRRSPDPIGAMLAPPPPDTTGSVPAPR